MGQRVLRHDWAGTSLGSPDRWPNALRSTVELMLPHGFAMIVLWGPDLIQIYNEAYSDLMRDKHPGGLGQPTRKCWPEVWHINAPIYERVFAGETVTIDDGLYPLARSGEVDDLWLTLTYSPVIDRAGVTAGILVTIVETTARVQVEKRLRASEERFRALVTAGDRTIYRMSADWRIMHQLDSRTLAVTAEPIEDWVGKYIPLKDLDRVNAAIKVAIDAKTLFELEHQVAFADGSVGWVLSRAVPMLDRDGQIVEWFGVADDVTDRHRMQERQAVLVAELQHRTRNLLGVVRSISGQTMRSSETLEQFEAAFNQRLGALSRVQGLLSRSENEPITIGALLRSELDALGGNEMPDRILTQGPEVQLRKGTVQTFALALHELATNARKYGALANGKGRLEVTWCTYTDETGDRLKLKWWEIDLVRSREEQSTVTKPGGYGRELIERALPYSLQARTAYDLMDTELICTIDLPSVGRCEPKD